MATENVLATQLTLGMIGAGLLQWLKSKKWVPFINQNSAFLNHGFLLATSALGGLGIHTAWNASDHSLMITGLNATAIATAAWLWAKQWTVQFLVHRGVFGQVATGSTAATTSTAANSPQIQGMKIPGASQ